MLEAGFIVLTLALLIVWHFGIGATYRNAGFAHAQIVKKQFILWAAIFVWITLIGIVSLTGFFEVMSAPPRIPLLIIAPLFAFTFWFLFSRYSKTFIHYFPKQLSIYYQAFRVFVELLILGMVIRGIGPHYVSFEGYNFDIVFGLLTPIVAIIEFRYIKAKTKMFLAWNFIGLAFIAIVVCIFNLCFLKPEFFGAESSLIKPEFGTMPFLLLPGFLMPSAVFMHVLSIRKLVKELKAENTVLNPGIA